MKEIPNGIFKSKAVTREAKHEATTSAAKSIIDDETAKREAKTERLRQARLASDETPPVARAKVKKAPAGRGAQGRSNTPGRGR